MSAGKDIKQQPLWAQLLTYLNIMLLATCTHYWTLISPRDFNKVLADGLWNKDCSMCENGLICSEGTAFCHSKCWLPIFELQLIQTPALAPLGLVMLKTTSEELACPREDLSIARKEELRKLLLEQVPTVLGLLTGEFCFRLLTTYFPDVNNSLVPTLRANEILKNELDEDKIFKTFE